MGTIIGISGKIGSGKTTCAKAIVEMDPRFKLVHFATALKSAASIILGLPIEHFYNSELKNSNIIWNNKTTTIGEFLQWFGTDLMRAQDPDVWVNALMNTYTNDQYWVIDDVRFENEMYAVGRANGYMIRLEGDPAGIRENSKRDLNHISETQLDGIEMDYIINTDDSLKMTRFELLNIINEIV